MINDTSLNGPNWFMQTSISFLDVFYPASFHTQHLLLKDRRTRKTGSLPHSAQQYSISIPEKVKSDKLDRGRRPKCRNIKKFSKLYVVTDDEMHPQKIQCHCSTTVTVAPVRPSPDHHLKVASNEIKESLQTK